MRSVLLILCFVPLFLAAQVEDDFSDGDFLFDPPWSGDSSSFEVNNVNQLHLISTGSDTSYLSTGFPVPQEAEWEFWIKLSFNTSLNNFSRIYLTSDKPKLTSEVEGYFLQMGGSGDSIGIYQATGQQMILKYRIPHGSTGHSTNTFRIRIIRESTGEWHVFSDSTGGKQFLSEGGFFDVTPISGSYFGIYCRYTSSNSTKFYFDDFYIGPVRNDTIPPYISRLKVKDSITVQLCFSEMVDSVTSLIPSMYFLLHRETTPEVIVHDPEYPGAIRLQFALPFPQGFMDSLAISGIADLAGNISKDTVIGIEWYCALAFDVLIHEVLADPDPPQNLPEGEFIELFNRSKYSINLADWKVNFSSTQKELPDVTIPSGGFLILAKDSLYCASGATALIFTSTTSLSNEGTTLVLKDNLDHIIHTVTYSSDWYGDSYKKEGGWSLEMIDPENPCRMEGNWSPSESSSGGTPGSANSVLKSNPDREAPSLLRGAITGPRTCHICFSEPVDSSTFVIQSDWELATGDFPIERLIPKGPDYKEVDIETLYEFEKGIVYSLQAPGSVHDCAGNEADTSKIIYFGIPDSVQPGDIILNEILFDPYPEGVPFIELFNASEKILDLHDLVTRGCTDCGLKSDSGFLVSIQSYLFFPGEYICLSEDPEDILKRYPEPLPYRHLKVAGMPRISDDSGCIYLAHIATGETIDHLQYSSGMHLDYMISTEGVSLEKLNPYNLVQDPGNWHSAASTEGYATPGRQNSHFMQTSPIPSILSVEPGIISPDNDGYNDIAIIRLSDIDPETRITLVVFDLQGRVIKSLGQNELPGSNMTVYWDGSDNRNRSVAPGYYIIYAEFIPSDGKKSVRKVSVSVAYDF